MKRAVEFVVEDGTILRGDLHYMEGAAPASGIVMAHGFSGIKEQIDHYAARFAKAGFSVLLFDHRGFGASAGSVRLEVDPLRQLADWQDAMTFCLGLAEVDRSRPLGVWGSSFAGGLAMVLAANDERVGCVVAQIPNVSGHRNARAAFNAQQRAELQERFRADRAARLAGEPPAMISIFVTDDTLCALPGPVTPHYIQATMTAFPTWRNEVTLRSLEHGLTFEPAAWVPFVSPTPLLMLVGASDVCTFPDIQLDVFQSANEPKRVLVHPGGHFDTYVKHFEATSGAAVDWFAQHLTVL